MLRCDVQVDELCLANNGAPICLDQLQQQLLTSAGSKSSSGLSTGAIVAIVVPTTLVVAGAAAGLLAWLLMKGPHERAASGSDGDGGADGGKGSAAVAVSLGLSGHGSGRQQAGGRDVERNGSGSRQSSHKLACKLTDPQVRPRGGWGGGSGEGCEVGADAGVPCWHWLGSCDDFGMGGGRRRWPGVAISATGVDWQSVRGRVSHVWPASVAGVLGEGGCVSLGCSTACPPPAPNQSSASPCCS